MCRLNGTEIKGHGLKKKEDITNDLTGKQSVLCFCMTYGVISGLRLSPITPFLSIYHFEPLFLMLLFECPFFHYPLIFSILCLFAASWWTLHSYWPEVELFRALFSYHRCKSMDNFEQENSAGNQSLCKMKRYWEFARIVLLSLSTEKKLRFSSLSGCTVLLFFKFMKTNYRSLSSTRSQAPSQENYSSNSWSIAENNWGNGNNENYRRCWENKIAEFSIDFPLSTRAKKMKCVYIIFEIPRDRYTSSFFRYMLICMCFR